MQLHKLEQGRHNHNHAVEHEIELLEKHFRRRMTRKVIPKRLWVFSILYEA